MLPAAAAGSVMADEEVPEDMGRGRGGGGTAEIKVSEPKLSENCTLEKDAIILR